MSYSGTDILRLKRPKRIISIGTKVWFGKHKGKIFLDVITNHPTYIRWAMSEDIFDLDTTAKNIYKERLEGGDSELPF